jgi:hypothetical protein
MIRERMPSVCEAFLANHHTGDVAKLLNGRAEKSRCMLPRSPDLHPMKRTLMSDGIVTVILDGSPAFEDPQ